MVYICNMKEEKSFDVIKYDEDHHWKDIFIGFGNFVQVAVNSV